MYTDYPAIYENTYGNGKVIYSAGKIEIDGFVANQELFTNLIKYLIGEQKVVVSAPKCVDHTVYESDKDLKINLLNSQTIYPPIPIQDVKVSVNIGDRKIKSVSDITGGQMSWCLDGESLNVSTDLSVYKLIVVEFE